MSAATLIRHDDTLVFTGTLDRAAVVTLWPLAQTLAGVRRLDLSAVDRVDSAGLALLAELAARSEDVVVVGRPEGLGELRAAYRLQDDLSFAS
jgi:phospholipid transport system transporter-binding protein